MQDNAARTIGTVAVWAGTTVILTWGVFGISWNGLALIALVMIVALICWAAAGATASIWGWKPKASVPTEPNEKRPAND